MQLKPTAFHRASSYLNPASRERINYDCTALIKELSVRIEPTQRNTGVDLCVRVHTRVQFSHVRIGCEARIVRG